MQKEFEIKYYNVNHDEVREKLIELNFKRTQEKRNYRCQYFHFEEDIKNKRERWGRIKDDGQGNILMGIKESVSKEIGGVEEADVYINSFEAGVEFFYAIGMADRGFYTMTREIWKTKDESVMVTLDDWSDMEPNVEIESSGVEPLKKYSELLGFDFEKADF